MDFLTYNGLLSAIPDAWKRSIRNSEESLNNSDEHNLTSVNVTAKIARKMLVLEMLQPPNVEVKLVEQNLPVKAIYELPFKVTMENKLRCFQYKVIHNILPTNNKLYKMKLTASRAVIVVATPTKIYFTTYLNSAQNSNFLANGNRLVQRKAIGNCRFKCCRYFIWL